MMRVILDLANNHNGSVVRGEAIVNTFQPLLAEYPSISFAVKVQYRDPTILHPVLTSKLTERVQSTMLCSADRLLLLGAIRGAGFLAGCTPFDEASVELLAAHGYDFCKVASCSLTDWPLLEKIAALAMPTIASTAGSEDADVSKAAQFLARRVPNLTLMHCVAEYPTLTCRTRLGRIQQLCWGGCPVGYSTHEVPSGNGCELAVALGATTFEWHIDLDTTARNAYSLTLSETRRRLDSMLRAMDAMADDGSSEAEQKQLLQLKRGAVCRKPIRPGDRLTAENVCFCLPAAEGQLLASDFGKYTQLYAGEFLEPMQPIGIQHTELFDCRSQVQMHADTVCAVLAASGVVLPRPAKLVLSHHEGLDRFLTVGCGMLTCVDTQLYAKKLVVLLPMQSHPTHKHRLKTETFTLLHGDCLLSTQSGLVHLSVGQQATILPGVWHSFSSRGGCVLEEVSTALVAGDSEYAEPLAEPRKTEVRLP